MWNFIEHTCVYKIGAVGKGVNLLTDIEKKLIKKCKDGDIGSFETLLKNYQKTAYNVAYRMMGNEEDAKDMAQEALIKVYKSIQSFRMDSEFSTWLYRIVMNVCKDELRKKKMKVVSIDKHLETEEGEIQMELKDSGPTPEEILSSKESIAEIQKAMMQMSETNREVLVLRDVKGFSYDEICDITGLATGTVKSRINRGRQELSKLLSSVGLLPSRSKKVRKEGV